MSYEEKCRFILRKYPEVKFKRGAFARKFGEEFYEIVMYATLDQFEAFFKDWESISRSYREVLKEQEFRLKPELDAQRYKKASEFQKQYAKKTSLFSERTSLIPNQRITKEN